MADLIKGAGYEHGRFECETEDGYLVNIDRITNKSAFNVILFVHGVLDSAQTWVVHGREKSAAYLAHRCGFDVFMGNFRGVYPRKLAPWKAQSTVSYWNYNIDDLGKYDIAAFVKKIIEVKVQEMKAIIKASGIDSYENDMETPHMSEIEAQLRAKIKITYVGHSMGGMTLPIYIIHSNMAGK
jgi:pimeloyl-ACP methyl ester carboxylesterase